MQATVRFLIMGRVVAEGQAQIPGNRKLTEQEGEELINIERRLEALTGLRVHISIQE